jgi:hypothetical protein
VTQARSAGAALAAIALFGCSAEPTSSPTNLSEAPADLQGFTHQASGGYHFLIPADFNGGIFGGAVDNRLTFHAIRTAEGTVSGSFNYEQTDFGAGGGVAQTYKGSVTCFKVYDTPVLQNFPDIPAKAGNRAKWGGPIVSSTDPTVPVGTFAWFNSIDNGEGSGSPPDLSSIFGLGDEAANEAFCNSTAAPNPNFGPHVVEGSIQVR